MSFDLFIGFFEKGEAVHRNRSVFDALRNAYGATWVPPKLSFRDGATADVYGMEHETCSSLMINHFGGEKFCDFLFDLVRAYGAVLYWPGDGPPLIADAAVADTIPLDMVNALGTPRVIDSSAEIVATILAS